MPNSTKGFPLAPTVSMPSIDAEQCTFISLPLARMIGQFSSQPLKTPILENSGTCTFIKRSRQVTRIRLFSYLLLSTWGSTQVYETIVSTPQIHSLPAAGHCAVSLDRILTVALSPVVMRIPCMTELRVQAAYPSQRLSRLLLTADHLCTPTHHSLPTLWTQSIVWERRD